MTSLDLEEILSGLDAQLKDKIVFIIDNVGSSKRSRKQRLSKAKRVYQTLR